MSSDDEQPTDSSRGNDQLIQFSLRNLLITITVLAIPLSLIPRLTLAWLCFTAGSVTLIAIVELLNYFQRVVVLLAGITFAIIGTAAIALIAAVAVGKVPGHDASSKLITSVVFGAVTALCYYLTWLAIHEAMHDSDNSKYPPANR